MKASHWILVIVAGAVCCHDTTYKIAETRVQRHGVDLRDYFHIKDFALCGGDFVDISDIRRLTFNVFKDVERLETTVGNGRMLQCVNTTGCDIYEALSATCERIGFSKIVWNCRFTIPPSTEYIVGKAEVDCESDFLHEDNCIYRDSCALLYSLKRPSPKGFIISVVVASMAFGLCIIVACFLCCRKDRFRRGDRTTTTAFMIPVQPPRPVISYQSEHFGHQMPRQHFQPNANYCGPPPSYASTYQGSPCVVPSMHPNVFPGHGSFEGPPPYSPSRQS